MKRKVLVSLLLSMVLVFGFTGCGGSSNEPKDTKEENTQNLYVEETKESESVATDNTSVIESLTATPEPTEAPKPDYEAMALNIEEKLMQYFDAWKNGDIETILSMTKPDDELYEYLNVLKEYEITERLLQTVYADIRFQEHSEALTDRVRISLEGERTTILLTNYMAIPYMQMVSDMIPSTLYQPGDIIEEGFCPANEEEALDIIAKQVENLPLVAYPITITAPDEDGNFYILEGERYFEFLIDALYTSQLDEDYLQTYVEEEFYSLGNKIVAAEDSVYLDNHSNEWPKVIELLKQKDFNGMFEYYTVLLDGSDLRGFEHWLFDENNELIITDAQIAYVNDYVDKIEVFHCDIARANNKEQLDTIYYFCPAVELFDKELQAWYTENDIKEVTFDGCLGLPNDTIEKFADLYISAAHDATLIIEE